MTRTELQAALVQLKKELLEAPPNRIEPNRKDPSTVGVADEDEQALSEMLQTLASQRNAQRAELVQKIDRALLRLRQFPDEAGLCEECEEEIGDKRLAVMPYATLCAACQAKRDPKRGLTRRSANEFK